MTNFIQFVRKPWVLIALGIIILLSAGAGLMAAYPDAEVEPEVIAGPKVHGNAWVTIADQVAGERVLVTAITVPSPGVWVAVHPVTEIGLGNVWGAVRTREPRTEVSVPMVLPTLPGKEYAIVLYRDDGDGKFDRATDSLYIDFETGERVETRFSTLPQ